jgi:steroid delta-isomerase-like uncharacterized protein
MTSQQTQSEQNKAVVRRFVEESNRANLSAYDQLLADKFVDHSVPPGYPNDREGQKQFAAMLNVAFPGGTQTVDDLISEGDKVVMRWTARGTHKGEFMGIPATNQQVTVTGIDIYRVVGTQIVEHWGEWDGLGMMQQLGVVPAPGQGGT